jgi:hypothetical protein
MATLSCISIQTIDAGDALAAALTAITGDAEPTWHPCVVDGTDLRGRTAQIGPVQIWEVPTPKTALPEAITIAVTDPDGVVSRLCAAGFDVAEHPDSSLVSASLTVAGVCIRIAAA